GRTVRATHHTATTVVAPSTTDGRRIASSLGPPVSFELTAPSQWKKGGFDAIVHPCSDVRLGRTQSPSSTMRRTTKPSRGSPLVKKGVITAGGRYSASARSASAAAAVHVGSLTSCARRTAAGRDSES